MKVVAWQEDIDSVEEEIKRRTGSTEKLQFPEGFVEEIGKIEDPLDIYVRGELTEYTDYNEKVPEALFFGYPYIKKVTLPNAKVIDRRAFYDSRLENIYAPNLQRISEQGFAMNTPIKNVDFPNLEIIDNQSFTFSTIENVSFPKVTKIGDNCFAYCRALQTISLPSLEIAGDQAIQGCNLIKTIELPNLKEVKLGLFRICSSLEKVYIPKVTNIHSQAFQGCSSLKEIIITQAEIICELENTDAFKNTPITEGTGFIYVPDSLVEDYKQTTNWTVYATQIKPLSEYVEE